MADARARVSVSCAAVAVRPSLPSLCTQVESCEPPVGGLDALVTQLNTDNDFALFVRAMRKKFKALC